MNDDKAHSKVERESRTDTETWGNVIAFPKPQRTPDDDVEPIALVTAALRELGEPATTTELAALVAELAPRFDATAIVARVLRSIQEGPRPEFPFPLFQNVYRGADDALAFTTEYRAFLRGFGFEPSLRLDGKRRTDG